MHRLATLFTCVLVAGALLCPIPSRAHDVDGPDDCTRHILDMGDAPEGIDAYPGVLGHFPTCLAPGAPGTYNFNCAPLGTAPGPTGYVIHETPATSQTHYWLGCSPLAAAPSGVDSEDDGKVNLIGAGSPSACSAATITDCAETAFGMTFGQDECYGDDDAGLSAEPVLKTCTVSSITFHAFSCGAAAVQAYLNILVDMNHDGDWNDNIYCNLQGACGNEWAVKNIPITLQPGCNTYTSPSFRVGPNAGGAWMRISLTDQPVNDDYPWAGSATTAGGRFSGGETEDYPLTIRLGAAQPCDGSWNDFGDAPENIAAYPGVIGHFPTCKTPTAPGTAEQACASNDPPPGPTGYVEHVTLAADATKVGLGCGNDPAASTLAVDDEVDGKVNLVGAGSPSDCQPAAITDATETAFGGMTFGQDESYGDDDAGVSPPTFTVCTPATVSFRTFNCGQQAEGYLNILVDMNQDGDWNDSFLCGTQCAREWAVRNQLIPLPAGCFAQTSPSFLIGPNPGHGWMRVSVSLQPAPDDFAWNGSASLPGGTIHGGETEDYPVEIGSDCNIAYRDFGDAPEGFAATSTYLGRYPTCIAGAASAGGQEIACGAPQSIAPPAGAVAGYVEHIVSATGPYHFWFGCGPAPAFGVDDESDAKTSPGTPQSFCSQIPVDCIQSAFGLSFGQDECFGDGDAGLVAAEFRACSTSTVVYKAYACDHAQEAYLNILVDWTQDGDWNDNMGCGVTGGPGQGCAPEWAVKNVLVPLAPGCNTYASPSFQVGSRVGATWMRMTLTPQPVPDDFPWNGSVSTPNGSFAGGETEDYPVTIYPPTTDVGSNVPSGDVWFAPPAPNPSARNTKIHFALPREANVKLSVYDLLGRRVNQLANGSLAPGEHTIDWDFRNAAGAEVPVGFYLVKLEVDGRILTHQVIHAR